ncbi:hypothetical protein [Pseudoalteromonas piscicida]|nr:hypothetical protein [Pseudoalteromonas piscicida]
MKAINTIPESKLKQIFGGSAGGGGGGTEPPQQQEEAMPYKKQGDTSKI